MDSSNQYTCIELHYSDNMAVVTLNRPDRLNAYTPTMGNELVDVFRRCERDDEIKAIVVTGSGRAFCSGADSACLQRLRQPANEFQSGNEPLIGTEEFLTGFCSELYHYPKPTIAAINGIAVGIGVTMTLPFDIRLASRSSLLKLPFREIGVMPGLGSTMLLPGLVGVARAKSLFWRGASITPKEAESMGLVEKVFGDDNFLQSVIGFCRELLPADTEFTASVKRAINAGALDGTIENAHALEQKFAQILLQRRATS
jgi:enoyl-CoA hydratase/carnithine racemase